LRDVLTGLSKHSSKYNLNSISHDAAASLVRATLERGVPLKEVYVDTVGPPEKYRLKLEQLFPTLHFVVTKKADSLYPIVSAASICAKVFFFFFSKPFFREKMIELGSR
jgi:ribonuclease H2 subunit A